MKYIKNKCVIKLDFKKGEVKVSKQQETLMSAPINVMDEDIDKDSCYSGNDESSRSIDFDAARLDPYNYDKLRDSIDEKEARKVLFDHRLKLR